MSPIIGCCSRVRFGLVSGFESGFRVRVRTMVIINRHVPYTITNHFPYFTYQQVFYMCPSIIYEMKILWLVYRIFQHFTSYYQCYLTIPSSNTATRNAENETTEMWLKLNNLTLNCSKSTEIIFTDPKRKSRQHPPPPLLPGTDRTSSVKILGVTLTNHLSVSEHVHSVTSLCTQHLYALKLLQAHGTCEKALQQVFRGVVISKGFQNWFGQKAKRTD